MQERPRVLEQLQVEFDRAARDTLTRPRAGASAPALRPLNVLIGRPLRALAGRRSSALAPRSLSVAAMIVALLVLAAAAAAAILIVDGSPLPAPHVQDLLSSGVPLPASAQLAALDARDPQAGQPPWDIRLSRTSTGETCTAVGQVLDGRFGIVGLDKVFRVLPLGGVDACGYDTAHGPLLAGARVFVGRDDQSTRTVVNGVAGAGVRSVTAYGPEGARPLALGLDGSFITVYRGYLEEVRPRIVVVSRSGATHTITLAQGAAYEVPDPKGGAPWQASASPDLSTGAYPDEYCAQASRRLDHANPSIADSSLTPSVCGRLGHNPLFVTMRRFVPGSGEHSGYPWGDNPARTIVYGVAAPRVASLTLSGAGTRRELAIARSDGVFMAVLDGHVDPRELTLAARLRSGATVSYNGTSNALGYENNVPLRQAPVPAYREPTPTRQATFPPFEIATPGSVRETLRHADPAGGAEWALRSWRGTPNPKVNGAALARGDEYLCFEVGVLRAGALMQARFGSPAKPLSVTPGLPGYEERCNSVSQLSSKGALYSSEAFVGNPYAYAPKPLRTIVSGQLAPGATHPQLLGAGAPRPLAVDGNHAFLAVLPGRYWDAWLHVAYTLHGHTFGTGAAPPSGFPRTPQARAPDPDESAPWGFAVAGDGASWLGRIVDGRLASVDELTGVVVNGPVESGSEGLLRKLHGGAPVTLGVQQVGILESAPGQGPAPLTAPQIERRTLPGRTIITGIASADVVSVTLATPSDVRTVRPSGPHHVFLVVYDGVFYTGTANATVLMRDGRTVTESLAGGLGVGGDQAPPRPSMRRTLQLLERQAAVLDANRARPSRLLPSVESEMQLVRRRIAYEEAHPGLLPGS